MFIQSEIGRALHRKHSEEVSRRCVARISHEAVLLHPESIKLAGEIHGAATHLLLTTPPIESPGGSGYVNLNYDGKFPLRNHQESPFSGLELHLKGTATKRGYGYRATPSDIFWVEVGLIASDAQGSAELILGWTVDPSNPGRTELAIADEDVILSTREVLNLVKEAASLHLENSNRG